MEEFSRRSGAAVLIGVLLSVALPLAASASVITQRDSAYTITFSNGLDTAATNYTLTLTMPAEGGNLYSNGFNAKTGNLGLTVGTTGGVTSTFSNEPAGTTTDIGNIYNNGTGGTFTFNYATTNGPDFTSSWTQSTVVSGNNALAFGGLGNQGFGGCGSNFLDAGGIFTCEVFIAGDWAPGTASGDGYISHLANGYSVINNFVYNPTLNETLVGISTGDYQGINPNLGLILVGSPVSSVPEPSPWTLLLAGLGMCAAAWVVRGRGLRQS